MDYGYSRKAEIERKLAEEQGKLAALKESLATADALTHNMVNILSHFDERLHKLEETIIPVHRETKDLQRLQDNIDKTIISFDDVISYHHVAKDIGLVLHQGPSRQVDRYIECMERLLNAVNFFKENNPDSPELNTVKQLFDVGKDKLESEFQGQLSRHSKPTQPDQLLRLKDDSGVKEEGQLTMIVPPDSTPGIIPLPPKAVSDLSKMAKWLSNQEKTSDYATNYATIRSSNLQKTIIALKEYIKDRASSGSRKSSNVRDTPKKSASRRARILEKRKEGLDHLAHYYLESIATGLKSAYPTIAEEDTVEIEIDPFLEAVTLAEKLFIIEYRLMNSILPDAINKGKIFDSIIRDSLVMLEQDGMKFATYAKQCIARHDHPSVVNIFPAVKHLKNKLALYLDLLKNSAEENKVKIPKLISELDATAVKVLDDFTDSVKSDPEKESNMPKDGTVHELTSNAMKFMQQLAQNLDVAGGILASQHHGTQQLGSKSVICLAQYTSHVLGALKLNLQNKSRVYVDQSLAAIFLLNNYNFILSALNRYGLLDLVKKSIPDVENIYKNVITEQKTKYLHCWDNFPVYLSDENKQGLSLHAEPGQKLKEKEKQVVKDKLKSFNNELDDLVKLHRTWAVPDTDIKTEIREALRKKILPPYTAFRDKYRMVQFTKNIEKYLKHTPETVGEHINTLFDQSTS
ncbi:exocyst complex component 7-like isoform X2 [Styela clava]